MNAAQVHLALNHLPIGLVIVGVPLLLAALLRKSKELKAAASIVLMLSALTSIPVFLSGEPAEEIVEHREGVSETFIHDHEEAAELSLIFIEILGALVLAAWLFERFRRPTPVSIWLGILALGVVSLGLFIRTAHLGGLIRHDELRSGAAMSRESYPIGNVNDGTIGHCSALGLEALSYAKPEIVSSYCFCRDGSSWVPSSRRPAKPSSGPLGSLRSFGLAAKRGARQLNPPESSRSGFDWNLYQTRVHCRSEWPATPEPKAQTFARMGRW